MTNNFEGWKHIASAPKDKRIIVWTGQERYCANWVQNPLTGDEAWCVSEANEWKRMHFADVVNGMPYAWVNGETSWTTNTAGNWNQCRRPTTEELEVRNEL